MLGIIIGVGAVIAMLAIGNGAKDAITKNIKSLGSNVLFIRPARFTRMGVTSGSKTRLTTKDLDAILKVDGVSMVSPEIHGSFQVKFMNNNDRVTTVGVAPTFFPMRNYELKMGRAFNDQDTLSFAKVAVIGPETADNILKDRYPIGKTIKIKGLSFKVIGVLKSKGSSGWMNRDDIIYIPFMTMGARLAGMDHFNSIDVTIKEEDQIEQAKDDIDKALRDIHRIPAEKESEFDIRDMTEILDQIGKTIFIFKLLLGGVAGLSLLVGGIGIMNIMFVSVTERTKEIGVRKAIGAKNRDILRQFLLEAVVLTVLGGAFGILFGWGSIATYNALSPDTYFKGAIDSLSVFISVAFSASVGVFFGFYPAFKASKLNPIDALRYE